MRRISILVLACAVAGCATVYSSMPGNADVVDAETGRPLAGVVVAASWLLSSFVDIDQAPSQTLVMVDAVTDQAGSFSFAAIGPMELLAVPIGRSRIMLDYVEPHLYLFKSGYNYVTMVGAEPVSSGFKGAHKSVVAPNRAWWDRRTFRLQRVVAGLDKYAEALNSRMPPLTNCRWTDIPHMAAAYIKEMERLRNLTAIAPRQSPQELLEESCSNATHPLAAYLE